MPSLTEQLSAGVNAFLGASRTAEEKLKENFQKAEKVTQKVQDLYTQLGSDLAIVKQAEEAGKLAAQTQIQTAKEVLITDSVTGGNRIITEMARLQEDQKKTRANLDEINKINTTNPFKEPIEYIVGQFKLPFKEEELKANSASMALTDKVLTDITQQLTQVATATQATKVSTSAAAAEAAVRVVSAEAQAKEQEAVLEGIKYNSNQINSALQMSSDRTGMLFQAKSAENAAKQLQISQAHLALDRERLNFAKEEANARIEAKKEAKQIDQTFLETVNISRKSFGLPAMSDTEYKTAKAVGGDATKDLAFHYANGQRSKTTGISYIGASPAESIANLSEIPSGLSTARAETASLLKQAQKKALERKDLDTKDKAKLNEAYNKATQEIIASHFDRAGNDPTSIFNVGDITARLKDPKIAALPITQKLLGPAADAKVSLIDPKVVTDLVIGGIKTGTISSAEAAKGLSEIIQNSILVTRSAHGLDGFGIVVEKNGMEYRTRFHGYSDTVDMANAVSLQRYFNRQLARSAAQERFNEMAEARKAANRGN